MSWKFVLTPRFPRRVTDAAMPVAEAEIVASPQVWKSILHCARLGGYAGSISIEGLEPGRQGQVVAQAVRRGLTSAECPALLKEPANQALCEKFLSMVEELRGFYVHNRHYAEV